MFISYQIYIKLVYWAPKADTGVHQKKEKKKGHLI